MGLLLLSMIVFWPIRVLVLSRVFYDGPYSSIFVNNEPRLKKKKKKTSVGSAEEKTAISKCFTEWVTNDTFVECGQ